MKGWSEWPATHIAELKRWFDVGLSFAQNAAKMNAKFRTSYTRNACIGKAKRLGLTQADKPKPKREKADRREGVVHAPPARARPAPIPKPAPRQFVCDPVTGLRVADVVPLNLQLLELGPDMCRWPYGGGPYVFCGQPTFDGCSYCVEHSALSVGLGTYAERVAA